MGCQRNIFGKQIDAGLILWLKLRTRPNFYVTCGAVRVILSFMAEVQTNTETGEMTRRFIEFVMMQQQNAALFLGLIPNPQTGKGEVNLDVARMFIDQLVMIRAKTRGNITDEELKILNSAISNLQMALVEVTAAQGGHSAPAPEAIEPSSEPKAEASQGAVPEQEQPAADVDSKKKFSKSYGS